MLNWSDRRIFWAIRRGRRDAFEAVISSHYASIYNFLAYSTGDLSLAEDLTQETFTSAWQRIETFEGRASFKTWLHRIAYHKFIDARRSGARDSNIIAKLALGKSKVFPTAGPFEKAVTYEDIGLLYEAIDFLEPAEQLVILLRYIQQLSFRQVALVIDEPAGTVKWRTGKALEKLRKILKDKVES